MGLNTCDSDVPVHQRRAHGLEAESWMKNISSQAGAVHLPANLDNLVKYFQAPGTGVIKTKLLTKTDMLQLFYT